jgi:hypothetical protein
MGRRGRVEQMKNHLSRITKLHKSETLKKSRFSRANLAIFSIIFATIGGYLIYSSFAAPVTCDLNATTSTFASQVSAATAGQTICLATGNYGTWGGTNKAITVTAASGAAVTMAINFDLNNTQNLTLDGTAGGGTITSSGGDMLGFTTTARNITIRNVAFTGTLGIDCPRDSNILLDHNTHNNINYSGGRPGRIHLSCGNNWHSGVTIQNSLLDGGSTDGIQAGIGVNIYNNEFTRITEGTCAECHTDAIQLIGAPGSHVKGNYLHNNQDGITAFDGLQNTTIENNVIGTQPDPDCIDMYGGDAADSPNSNNIIKHNTCGPGMDIYFFHKGNIPSSDSIVKDNIVPNGVALTDSVRMTVTNNVTNPIFVGGANASTLAGLALTSNSPGKGTATDGGDVGAIISTVGPGGGSSTPFPSVSLSANPTSVVSGSTSTLTWSSANATSCTASASPSNSNWTGTKATSGSQSSGALANTTTFNLSCTDGTNTANGSATVTITTPPSQTPIASYNFNEGTGTLAADSSGNNNNLTMSSSSAWTATGKNSKAASFNGTTNSQAANSSTLAIAATGTMEVWFKPNTLGQWHGLISKGNNNTDSAHNYALEIDSSNKASCTLGDGAAITNIISTAALLSTTAFTHIACTWDGTNIKIYINGTLDKTAAQTVTPASNTSPLFIGQFGGGNDITNGVIDDVRLYNRALSSTEVTTDMNTAVSATTTGPKQGDINGDNTVNITDLSLLLSSYGQNTTQCITNNAYQCDLSSPADGVVNIFDLSILLSKYGT